MNSLKVPETKNTAEPEEVYDYAQYDYFNFKELEKVSIFEKRLTPKKRLSLIPDRIAAKNKYRKSIHEYNQLLSKPFEEAELITMFEKDHNLFFKKEDAHRNFRHAPINIPKEEFFKLKVAEQEIENQIEALRKEREEREKKLE